MTRVFLSHWLLQQIVHGQGGVVLLLPEGPQIPDRAEGESGHRGRLLKSNRLGQGGLQYQRMGGAARQHEEDTGLLQGWPFGSCSVI